ncbi:ArnT family glycosyltransferase [Flavobacterium enshiense]|uniref:Glycosyltransferase RgtA/B/C/D-like domain-containing protein n=1 Tax=Flavobacterium enshiense DK69 TaxID=1107311 RepID=A0A0A2MTJ1_9FLAO|nr:glycosyltransferase family 39 protein [Flavobacterium enshiense]KGO95982.1 hypothetical protein Q767_06870 [Flavobacterium enshiense DK69]
MKIKSKHIIYLFPLLVWAVVCYGFSFDGLYGQDAYEYLRYTEALKTFLETGKTPGDYFWGVYYPIFGCLLSFVIPNTAIALQLISVLSLIVTSVYLDKIIRLTYQQKSVKHITFIFFTLSPIVLIHSMLAMSDMLACCFTTVAIYYLLLFIEKSGNRNFIIGAILVAFALLTRYAAMVILLPFCILAFMRLIKNRSYFCLFFSAVTAALVAIPHIIIRSQNSFQFLSHQWLQAWDILNLFRSDFVTVDGEQHYRFINIFYAFFSFFHPIFLAFGIVFLLFFLKSRKIRLHKYQQLFLTAIILYALFLGAIPFQNKRFLILSFPLVIAFLFPFLSQLAEVFKNRKLIFPAIFLIQLSLGLLCGKSFYERNTLESTIADEVEKYEGNTLYSFDIDIALKGRKLNFNYKSLWKEEYSEFKKNALLLVNEKQVEKQWKGKNPLLNWENVKNNYQLAKLKSFEGDFNLYRIDAKK